MRTAYLYVRVSTDEQKRKGYSLPEQEDRLLKYCEYNNIEVKGIYREDFSAKNFNRPEWKKLVTTIKKNSRCENNILFIKWDRFSRNIEYAYEMIGILRKYHATAMAIDQPIDFTVPESSVMLAVYLAIPEAENGRRALNTANGIRRAKQMGRYPNKAPLGYKNVTGADGKKYIEVHKTNAEFIKWSFQQLAKNAYPIEHVRRMANTRGLKCSRSRFWKLIKNPIYCGYITLISKDTGECQLIRGVHDPLISEVLFYEVQDIINTKRKPISKPYELNDMFILRKFLICPYCFRKLSGSFSKGLTKKYPYYHCIAGCKGRFKAEIINKEYESKLNQFKLIPKVEKLFQLVLEDVNIDTQRHEHLLKKRLLLTQIDEQNSFVSKIRKLFVAGEIEFDDFCKLKKEYYDISNDLKDELNRVKIKLGCIDKQFDKNSFDNIFTRFNDLEVNDKKHIINFIPPNNFDNQGAFSLELNKALSKILTVKKAPKKSLKNLS